MNYYEPREFEKKPFYTIKEVLYILSISRTTYHKRFPEIKGKKYIFHNILMKLIKTPIPEPKKPARPGKKTPSGLLVLDQDAYKWIGGAWGKRRTFSCEKWGFEEAKAMAEAVRDEYLIKFKPKGHDGQ